MKLTRHKIRLACLPFPGLLPLSPYLPGFYRRAQRAFKRNLAEPGDCKGDYPLLAGLAIAEAIHGRKPGWIPLVQDLGCRLARHINFD